MIRPVARRVLGWAGLASAYFLVWVLPRLSAIRANVLFWDDFAAPRKAAQLYLGSFRPLLYLEYRTWELLVPGHFWTPIPKWSAAAYMALAAVAFAILLRRWSVSYVLAVLLPLIFLSHPILDEVGLWPSIHGIALSILFMLTSLLVLESGTSGRRVVLAIFLMFLGVSGYQIYIAIPMIALAAEPIIKKATRTHYSPVDSARKVMVVAAVAALAVASMIITRPFLPWADARGLVHVASLPLYFREKLHGAFDLVVNAYMPIAAFYLGISRAWSAWKWVPILISFLSLIAAMARRLSIRWTILMALSPILLPALAAAPTAAMSQSPFAWRVSVPAVFAAILSAVPFLSVLEGVRGGRVWAAAAVLFTVLILLPVTRYDVSERVRSNRDDSRILAEIEDFWHTRGISRKDFRVSVVVPEGDSSGRIDGTTRHHDLSVGYERVPATWLSAFSYSFSWKDYVTAFKGLQALDCDVTPSDRACLPASGVFDEPDRADPQGLWRVRENLDARVAVIHPLSTLERHRAREIDLGTGHGDREGSE